MKWRYFSFFLFFSCFLLFFSCDRTPKELKNLIIITLDTTRADRLACYGNKEVLTPNLDQLAKEGTRFEYAISHVPLTLPSHSSIFTGRYPMGHGVHDNIGFQLPAKMHTLAEELKSKGYATGGFIAAKVLLSRFGINQGFDTFNEEIPEKQASRNAEAVLAPAQKWLQKQGKKPFFSWIHLYDPHLPYEHPEPFWSQYKEDPYNGEIAYTDYQIGKLIAFLKKQQLYQNTLIMVVGDHGESLGEHQEPTHGYFPYDSTMRIPFLIKPVAGIQTDPVIEDQVRHIDVMPTALSLLGFKIPKSVQGTDLSPLLFKEKKSLNLACYSEAFLPFYKFGFSPIRTIRTQHYRLLDDSTQKLLYDLQTDPKELKNIIHEKPEVAKALAEKLRIILETYTMKETKDSTMDLDSELLKALAPLGYTGNSIRPIAEGADAPSSIEGIIYHKALLDANSFIAQEKFVQAQKCVDSVLQQFPEMNSAHHAQATLFFRQQQYRKAIKYLEKIIQHNPSDVTSQQKLAMCYFAIKKLKESQKILEKTLELSPDYEEARDNLWKIYFNTKKFTELKELINKEIQRKPKSGLAWVWKGRLAKTEFKIEESIFAYLNATQDPSHAQYSYFELGKLYRDQKKHQAAIDALKNSLKYEKKDLNIFFNLAYSYFETKQYEKALLNFEKAYQLKPKKKQLEFIKAYLIKTHLEIGRQIVKTKPKNAQQHLTSALNLKPKNYQLLLSLAKLNINLQETEEAYNLILKGLSYKFSIAEKLTLLKLLEHLGKQYEALNQLLILTQENPKEKLAHYYLGELGLKLKLRKEAIAGFSAFLKLHDQEDDTRKQVEKVLQQLQPEKGGKD